MRMLFYGFRHGHIYGLYDKAYADPDIDIVACAEPDAEARDAAEKRLGITLRGEGLDALLGEMGGDIDTVAICTRYGDRGGAVIAALKAGKHVICDKPVCTSLSELCEIRRLSEERGLCVACMLDLRYTPAARTAKRLFDEGMLGQVRGVSINGQHYIDPKGRPSWYFEAGMHGGTINDLAIHGIDLTRWLTGLEFTEVDGVRSWNAFAVSHKDFKDCAMFMARLDNGAEVIADVSYSAPSQAFSLPSYWEFRFWCERGMLTFCYNDERVTVYEDGCDGARYFDGTHDGSDWLTELKLDVASGDLLRTRGVLCSTETALKLQAEC